MVSQRCKMVVAQELKKLGLLSTTLELGMVELSEDINADKLEKLKKNLLKTGLEILDDNKSILIEKIKNVIIEMIYYLDELPEENYSDYISTTV